MEETLNVQDTELLGRVTGVANGVTEAGQAWFRADVAVRQTETPYEAVCHRVVGLDRVAEKMKAEVQVGMALYVEGIAEPDRFAVREWCAAGIVPEVLPEVSF